MCLLNNMPIRARQLFSLPMSLLICCFALFLSVSSHALKVGDITVNSVVGERFFAVVPLDDISRSQANNILVSLAPRSVYQRLGVDFEYFHTGFIFDVLVDDRNRVYLRVVSKDVVYEPYIDFVVSLRWPGGFQSHQFTALLDMPLSSAAQPAPSAAVNRPITATPEAQHSTEPQPSQKPQPSIKPDASRQAPAVVVTAVPPAPSAIVEPQKTETVVTEPIIPEPPASQERLVADNQSDTDQNVESKVNASVDAEPIVEPSADSESAVLSEEVTQSESESQIEQIEQIEIEERSTQAEQGASLPQPGESNEPSELAADEAIELESVQEVIEEVSDSADITTEPTIVVEEREAAPAARVEAAGPDEVGNIDSAEVTAASGEPDLALDAQDGIEQIEQINNQQGADSDVEPGASEWNANSQRGDTLWALARQIHSQSGGRVVDIVNALHKHNQHAFIGGDANLLRVGQQLTLNAKQLYLQTPEKYRGALQADDGLSVDSFVDSFVDSGDVQNAAQDSSVDAGQDGVLSLVARDSADRSQVSDLTASLSQEAAEAGDNVDGQIRRASEQVESVETRMDELIEAYQSLAAKTDQLKAIESSLDEAAEKDALPVLPDQPDLIAEETPNAPAEATSTPWLTWFLAIVGVLFIIVAAYWLSTLLKARRIQQHQDWIERDWDEELFDGDMPVDEDVGGVVELRGESAFVKQQSSVEYGGAMQEGLIDDAPNEGAAELQASLYIAYERYAEAEKLILENLAKDPTDTTLKSMLLEVYAATGQDDAFERLAAELVEVDAANFEKKVSALRN